MCIYIYIYIHICIFLSVHKTERTRAWSFWICTSIHHRTHTHPYTTSIHYEPTHIHTLRTHTHPYTTNPHTSIHYEPTHIHTPQTQHIHTHIPRTHTHPLTHTSLTIIFSTYKPIAHTWLTMTSCTYLPLTPHITSLWCTHLAFSTSIVFSHCLIHSVSVCRCF